MCEWCEQETPEYCQDCGRIICQDNERGGDDILAAPYVTSYGDLYCWFCGAREQALIEEQEADEAAEWGFMDFDPYG